MSTLKEMEAQVEKVKERSRERLKKIKELEEFKLIKRQQQREQDGERVKYNTTAQLKGTGNQTTNLYNFGPLIHKRYFGGAHAYMVAPEGAKLLIEKAKTDAGPTDVFLNIHNFPWLQEYYPWIAEAKDSFTTIQKEKGCLAKHNYNENYEIL